MEATALSVGKAVLDGVVGYAKSAAAEEMALQLGVERDVGFIADELEMMQSFLMTAHEERNQNNKVLNTWVKQVRNVAYNVEDNLVDFEIHAEQEKPPLLGCIPRNLCDRRRIAMEVKELKAKVEDVSSRNLRYRLIKDTAGGSKPVADGVEHGGIASAGEMFGVDEAWRVAMEQEKPKVNLGDLIISKVVDLQAMAVWGTSGNLGKTSLISKVFEDPTVKAKFGCRAWVRLVHPFDPKDFLQSLVRQFYVNSSKELENSADQEGRIVGADILLKMEKMEQSDFIHEFKSKVRSNRYIIVIDDLATIDEWHCIKTYFPDKKNGSRIIVATQQTEIASLCPEQPYQASILEQMSSDQIIYLFHKKVEGQEMDSPKALSKTTTPSCSATNPSEIQEEEVQQQNSSDGGNVVSSRSTIRRTFYHSKRIIPEDVVGRSIEKQKIIDLVGHPNNSHGVKVICVWGMGGIGKTTLVRSVYRSQELSSWKRAWGTVLRPFNRDRLLQNLALQLQDPTSARENNIITMKSTELHATLLGILESQNCLIVLDDLSSTEEWNSMKFVLAKCKRIIATTRVKIVAKNCSEDDQNMYSLRGLEEATALDLFKKKVFKGDTNFNLYPSLLDLAKLILKKCDGLPLAISTIGGYLANRPHNAMEWKKLNNSLSSEIETTPELKMINTALMRSYDGLPYHLKSCFLYLAIFPEDHKIKRKHIVKRWIAEGFLQEMHHMTAEQVGNKYFDELLDRSMTLPSEEGIGGDIHYCQLHDLIHEICVSKAREENLVFTLQEGRSGGSTHGAIRHLVISSNWNRDKDVMQRMLDFSYLRSLTVFGKWRSFFISNKMRFLRVLDLEHTLGLKGYHLDQIMELLHLRYLSLRNCVNILKLPDSLANLRQLQTLDVRNTHICMLPNTVTSLQKLQYLRGSSCTGEEISLLGMYSWLVDADGVEYTLKEDHTLMFKALLGIIYCIQWTVCLCRLFWRPQLLADDYSRRPDVYLNHGRPDVVEGVTGHEGVTRHDVCNMCCYLVKHKGNQVSGFVVPIRISKMKALHTLCGVSVARGKATFHELRKLTQLRKLGVTDLSEKNNKKFWHAIARHSQLRSLSVTSGSFWDNSNTSIDDSMGETLCPPKSLESLKISGKLTKVREWIHQLQNILKLQLEETLLNQDAIHAIGMLPNLAILRLKFASFAEGQLRVQSSSFQSLSVLELFDQCVYFHLTRASLVFEREAMPKLELLQVHGDTWFHEIFGLQFLLRLKEIQVDDRNDANWVFKEFQKRLAEYPNNVTLKMK